MSLQKDFFFLSPVEVVKVTTSNLQEVAEWCEGQVASTESRRRPGTQDSYVWVPTPKGSKVSWAFPGMFITKRLVRTIKDEFRVTYAVFRRDYFEKNYFDTPAKAVEETWEAGNKKAKQEAKAKKDQEQGPVTIVVNVNTAAEAEQVVADLKASNTLADHPLVIEDAKLEQPALPFEDREPGDSVDEIISGDKIVERPTLPEKVEFVADPPVVPEEVPTPRVES